jgi:hypothetical protein
VGGGEGGDVRDRSGVAGAGSRARRRAAWIGAWLALVPTARADEPTLDVEPDGTHEEREVARPPISLSHLRVRPYTEQTLSLLADFGPADASELRSELGVGFTVPLSQSLVISLSAAGRGAFFFYDGDDDALAQDLGIDRMFDELWAAEAGLGAAYRLTPDWWVFGEGRAKLAWQDGASLSDALKAGGAVGVGWQIHPRFSLALGVQVNSRIAESGVSVDPVVDFRWDLRDDMRIQSSGLGLRFEWELDPKLEFQLGARYESDRYRLDDDETTGLDDTVLRQRSVPILAILRWKPSDHWRVNFGLGSRVYQRWSIDTDPGSTGSATAGPSALGWLLIQYRF